MNIVVLCGGISTERDISIVSGVGVCGALREKGHRAILLDVFFGDESADLTDAFPAEYDTDAAAERIHARDGEIGDALADESRPFFGENVLTICQMADIVFLALHGESGENGMVQAAFDLRRIRYTGTGHLGSAMAMDKGITKMLFRESGIPTPGGFSVRKGDPYVDPVTRSMTYPLVVKVCCGGSSVGVYIVHDEEEYQEALLKAFFYEDEVIVEDYVEGREFSVGVVDGKALPVIEIAPLEGFYDYKNKYTAGAAVETCPANLPEELTRRMMEYAEDGYRALRLEAYGRLDFIMRENGEMFCLEANTLPGMTPTSLIPQEAAALGIDYPTFCEQLIEASLRRYERIE